MDARTQAEAAARLDGALKHAGLAVERGTYSGGNLSSWEPVPGAAILGHLMRITGWRIRLVGRSNTDFAGGTP